MVPDRKIAFINLTDRSIEIKPIPLDLRKKFWGGRGINTYLLSKSYSSPLDHLSPENPLIFGAGRLTGEVRIRDNVGNRFVWNRIHAERCPFDALPVLKEKSYHCDLCGGDPQWIKVWTPKAIRITR